MLLMQGKSNTFLSTYRSPQVVLWRKSLQPASQSLAGPPSSLIQE